MFHQQCFPPVCQCFWSVWANETQRNVPADPVLTNEKAPLHGVMSAVQRDGPGASTEKCAMVGARGKWRNNLVRAYFMLYFYHTSQYHESDHSMTIVLNILHVDDAHGMTCPGLLQYPHLRPGQRALVKLQNRR